MRVETTNSDDLLEAMEENQNKVSTIKHFGIDEEKAMMAVCKEKKKAIGEFPTAPF
jgi:hypothetical protein